MNTGAHLADTPFLLFLHADTTLPDDGVNQVINALQDSKFVWGRFDVSFDNATPVLRLVAWFMNWRSALTGICTGDQAIFMTTAAYSAVSGFDEIPLMEDIEISKKLKSFSKPIRIDVPVVTAARRWRNSGPVRTILKMWWLRLRYWFGTPPENLVKWYNDAR